MTWDETKRRLPEAADVIKFFAVITAGPRWVVALLWADGVQLPAQWEAGWQFYSALSAFAMAVVEGVAFAYIFSAWKRETDEKRAFNLLVMAVIAAATFVALLTPSIAASVAKVPLTDILPNRLWLIAWSAAVAFSTIIIVAGVGYAQKAPAAPKLKKDTPPTSEERMPVVSVNGAARVPETQAEFISLQGELNLTWGQWLKRGLGKNKLERWMKAYKAQHA